MKTPKYITTDIGPDGKERFYFRRPGQKKIRVHGVPWTPSFMAEYETAKGGIVTARGIAPKKAGTFSWWCDQYYVAKEFIELDEELSKPRRKNMLGRICREPVKPGSMVLFGDIQAKSWTKKAVKALRDRHASTPGTANDMIAAIRAVFSHIVDDEESGIEVSPARDVDLLQSNNPDGYHSWTLEEVEQFEAKHAVGTKERLALGLLLYSSQRLSDAIALGPPHVKLRDDIDENGEPIKRKWLVFTQNKNRRRKPVHLEIPLRPELEELIDATPIGENTFLTAKRGGPFTRVNYTKWFADACIVAKVPGRSHGLRKASAARLAENGATDKEIMSITGHTTLKEVARYTKAANQKLLASAATDKMKPKVKVA